MEVKKGQSKYLKELSIYRTKVLFIKKNIYLFCKRKGSSWLNVKLMSVKGHGHFQRTLLLSVTSSLAKGF